MNSCDHEYNLFYHKLRNMLHGYMVKNRKHPKYVIISSYGINRIGYYSDREYLEYHYTNNKTKMTFMGIDVLEVIMEEYYATIGEEF